MTKDDRFVDGQWSTSLFPVHLLCSDAAAAEADRCRYACCCTSCAVGDLAASHEPGAFCCAGSWRGACCLYGTLSMLPPLLAAYPLGPLACVFCLPLGGLFRLWYVCEIRCQLRRTTFKIRGRCCISCCHDFLCAYVCESCTVMQALRETEIRRGGAAIVFQQPTAATAETELRGL